MGSSLTFIGKQANQGNTALAGRGVDPKIPTRMPTRTPKQRVALVGTGFVAKIHLEVLRQCRGVEVVALVDPVLERARELASEWRIERVHGSVAELLEKGGIDAAHVLVPPDAHAEVTEALLRGGVHVLVEKPMATTSADVEALAETARRHDVVLGVNHSQLGHPVVQRLEADVGRGALGRLQQVHVVHSVPLRQLDSGDVSHFMFRSEANILLEQAVHPLSIVQRLLGRCLELTAGVEPALRLPTGEPFRDTWTLSLRCERGTAVVFLAFGRPMQETTLHAVGTDGTARLDLTRTTYQLMRKTRWLEFWDHASNGLRNGRWLIQQGLGSAVGYGLGLFKLKPLADSYLHSMGASVASFHEAARERREPPCSATSAAQVVEMCEMAASSAGVSWQLHPRFAAPLQPSPARTGEVLITGGTGFLGRYLVPILLEAGHPVTLLVRRPEFLPESLRDSRLRLLVGDARDREAVLRAVEGVSAVVHMATCAAGPGERNEESMSAGARAVGEACLQAKVERLVFVSSTAALYLGGRDVVEGSDPPDPRPRKRAEYSRGKIAAERTLRDMEADRGLPLVIVRPAVVVGEGGVAEHSGVGLWVRDNHCVGWGMGANPLPFVLARDCADAIAKAVVAPDILGKAYNLAGPVRPTAREWIAQMRRRTGRRYHFHPQPIWSMVLIEGLKWLVKVAARRPGELPSWRDFGSRSFASELSCGDAVRDLDWNPEADRERFLEQAIPAAGASETAPSPAVAVDAS